MSRNTNADRARDAGFAFQTSEYSEQNNDPLTNIGDLICDLAHYADTLKDADGLEPEDGDTNGLHVISRGEWHYREERREEEQERLES